jgi:hypothetical protein
MKCSGQDQASDSIRKANCNKQYEWPDGEGVNSEDSIMNVNVLDENGKNGRGSSGPGCFQSHP